MRDKNGGEGSDSKEGRRCESIREVRSGSELRKWLRARSISPSIVKGFTDIMGKRVLGASDGVGSLGLVMEESSELGTCGCGSGSGSGSGSGC